ncbi:Uncharacterised protein [Yersinia wautersii]|uniref:Uncharacterized protein n=1 Tax=Yersinia wautersii TaxID=1341643 RepID=A0ABP1ZFG6_9GAMM|nr:Uncharacterised protein [Yersinia wautersii]
MLNIISTGDEYCHTVFFKFIVEGAFITTQPVSVKVVVTPG